MADTFNSFAFLHGSGEQVVSAKKNKKKTKPKPKPEAEGSTRPAEPEAAPPAAPAPADRSKHVDAKATDPAGSIVDVAEACALVEKQARTNKSGNDRLRLWKDWIRQATDKGPKPLVYRAAGDVNVDFKQMLLSSTALEITVQGCLTSPLHTQNENNLVQLLGTFLPGGERVGQALAAAVTRLAGLLAGEAPDIVGAAQRAVQTTVNSLKSGYANAEGEYSKHTASEWCAALEKINADIAKQNVWMAKMAGVAAHKEQANCAAQIMRLQAQKFDMLQPGHLPGQHITDPSDPTVHSLLQLRSTIQTHLQEATSSGTSSNQGSSSSQSAAAYKREEAALTQQATELSKQIKALQAQLASLHAQAAEIEDKRAQVRQRGAAAAAAASGMGYSLHPGGSGPSAAHYQDQLDATDALLRLVDPSAAGGAGGAAGAEDVAQVAASEAGAAADYLSSAGQYLQLCLATLSEVPGRLSFCAERLDKADKLLRLSHSTTAVKPEAASKQREEAEKLLSDTRRGAQDTMSRAMEALNAVRGRYMQLRATAPEQAHALGAHMQHVDQLGAACRAAFDAAMAQGAHGQPAAGAAAAVEAPVAAVAPAAAAAPAPGPRGGNNPATAAAGASVSASTAAAAALQALRPASAVASGTRAPAPSAPAAAPASAAPRSQPPAVAPHGNGQPALQPASAAAAAAPPPHPTPAPAPARQWGKVAPPPPSDESAPDASLPTPAEAFKSRLDSTDEFKQVGKRNRKKA